MFDNLKKLFKEDKKKEDKTVKTKPSSKESKQNKANTARVSKKDQKKDLKNQLNKKDKSQKTNQKDSKSEKTEDKPSKNHDDNQERHWPNKVKAIIIVELMGTPQEHIKNTMELYLERIKEDNNMVVEHEDLAPIEKKDSFFLQFVELTIEFKSVKKLIEFCFDYMPSSIEIIEPANITYDSQNLSDIVNDLQAKLHQLDMIIKNLRAENKILNDNGNLLLRNIILVALKEEKTFDEIVKATGVNKEAVEKFLENLVSAKLVSKKAGKYIALKSK